MYEDLSYKLLVYEGLELLVPGASQLTCVVRRLPSAPGCSSVYEICDGSGRDESVNDTVAPSSSPTNTAAASASEIVLVYQESKKIEYLCQTPASTGGQAPAP